MTHARRNVLLLGVIFSIIPSSLATAEPYVVLADWSTGTVLAGAPVGVDGVDRVTIDIAVPACQREILLDLFYAPENASANADTAASVTLAYDWTAALVRNGTQLAPSAHVTNPGYGVRLGVAPAAGNDSATFFLRVGANVSWQARVRGHEVAGDPACALAP